MDKETLTLGLIILIASGWLFYYFHGYVAQLETSLGQASRMVNEDLQKQYLELKNYELICSLGIVLGLVILAIGALRGQREPPSESRIIVKVRCPKCKTMNDESVNFCIKCGSSFTKVRCSNCETMNDESAKFCIKCGSTLRSVSAPNEDSSARA